MEDNRPLNFEQACNYLDEKKETLAEDTKKDAQGFDAIVNASPESRKKALMYWLCRVDWISPAVKKLIPAEFLLGGGESNKELLRSMKHFMTLRIYGHSLPYISNYLGRSVQSLLKMEKAAIVAIREEMEKTQKNCIPILGRG
ncbi:MAG TPA: hypothetical protein DCL42_10365 [Deltaproteobacteria bacterium]|nr:hypothetical protein [Deltaproteobacteria bacterium]